MGGYGGLYRWVRAWVGLSGIGGEMGHFVWNSMYKCAGLRLTPRWGPGAVGSAPRAPAFPGRRLSILAAGNPPRLR